MVKACSSGNGQGLGGRDFVGETASLCFVILFLK